MSSKKFKKIPKRFYSYPGFLEELADLAKDMEVSETEIIEAGLVFFLRCPPEIQERIYKHYHYCCAKLFYDSQDAPNLQNILRDILQSEKKSENP